MVKVGKWIAKYKAIVLIVAIVLLIPAFIGMETTRVNYDLLSYLPDSLDTVRGQDIMVEEYGAGAFSMVVCENMEMKDVSAMKTKFENVEHVEKVLWYDSVADISMPVSMIPKKYREAFFKGDATLMVVLYDNTTSSDEAMGAITEMRKIANKQCFISGMPGIVTDIKDVAMAELPMYVVIAAALCFVVLLLTTEYYLIPVFFLLSIGMAIVYNLGTNVFLGSVSYITKALVAVLQLGVTMDYSIFLLHSYEEFKEEYPDDHIEAMGHAISATFTSIVGSSVTTVAGFIALCFMTFALGRDLGIVSAKGVVLGVICCVTVLPSFILFFDKPIEKTKHKPLIKSTDRLTDFVLKHNKLWVILFIVLLIPATYGYNNVKMYYNIARSLPSTLDSNVATEKLKEDFDMSTIHVIMMDKNLEDSSKRKIISEVKKVEGVKWCIGIPSLIGPSVPTSMIPSALTSALQGDTTEMIYIGSTYESATDEVNAQIASIQEITQKYDQSAIVIGEAPMMKDLEDTNNVDTKKVNIASVAAIFLIILIIFKSVSLPVILVAAIEFAIACNMAVPFYSGEELAFVASIVIGTIQLGATVDYAILMTNRYVNERKGGKSKKEAIRIAHSTCTVSIITSGLSFFAATFGVAMYSQVDMIGSICTLLARGSIISMAVVIFILPSFFNLFDRLICRTTKGLGNVSSNQEG